MLQSGCHNPKEFLVFPALEEDCAGAPLIFDFDPISLGMLAKAERMAVKKTKTRNFLKEK